ncbi:hypothetical protein GF325_11300 [Candidatus Bathyarchaeota archaeon]|nr:hypothetical protein [Candidatus Bathyarchaeota archaeon]
MKESRFNWKVILAVLIVTVSGISVLSYALPSLMNLGNDGEDVCDNIMFVENITIQVQYKNGTNELLEDLTKSTGDFTVFSIMSDHFTIEYEVYPNGYLITRINGKGDSWLYWIDGVSPGKASSLYCLKNDSFIEWVQK